MELNTRERLLALFDQMNGAQQHGVLMAAEASMFYATLQPTQPTNPPMVPHAECLARAAALVDEVSAMALGKVAVSHNAPSLLEQMKDVYCEGLRVGMDLGRKWLAPKVEVKRAPADRPTPAPVAVPVTFKQLYEIIYPHTDTKFQADAAAGKVLDLLASKSEVRIEVAMTPEQERVLRAAAQWWVYHNRSTLVLDCDQELRVAVSALVQRGKVTPGLEKPKDAVGLVVRLQAVARAAKRYFGDQDAAVWNDVVDAVRALQDGDLG